MDVRLLLAVCLTACSGAQVIPDAHSSAPPSECPKAIAVSSANPEDAAMPLLGPGVWMCTDLAANKAASCTKSETCCKTCLENLKATTGWSWKPLVVGIVLGVVGGTASAVGVYEIRNLVTGQK